MSLASALAGYVDGKHGELIACAVMLNGPLCLMERAWEVQDAVVEALMRGGALRRMQRH
jgi:hypothetical protein